MKNWILAIERTEISAVVWIVWKEKAPTTYSKREPGVKPLKITVSAISVMRVSHSSQCYSGLLQNPCKRTFTDTNTAYYVDTIEQSQPIACLPLCDIFRLFKNRGGKLGIYAWKVESFNLKLLSRCIPKRWASYLLSKESKSIWFLI